MAPAFFNVEQHPGLVYPVDKTILPEASESMLFYGVDNPRFNAAWMHLQSGTWLDYFFGEHEPRLSAKLQTICGFEEPVSPNEPTRCVGSEEARQRAIAAIPEKHQKLIPQPNVSKEWPPLFFLHGTADTAAPLIESESLFLLLDKEGVPTEIRKVEGEEHNFDFDFEVEKKRGRELQAAIDFVHKHTVR